jgi:hypothetical protein
MEHKTGDGIYAVGEAWAEGTRGGIRDHGRGLVGTRHRHGSILRRFRTISVTFRRNAKAIDSCTAAIRW